MAKFLAKDYIIENGQYVGVKFTLGDGREQIMMNDDYDPSLLDRAVCHCSMQKIGDAASGFSKASDYLGAFQAMGAVIESLVAGQWARRMTSGTADIVQALSNLTGKSLSEAQEVVDKLNEDTLKKLQRDPNIKAEVARLKAERAANAVSKDFDLEGMFT